MARPSTRRELCEDADAFGGGAVVDAGHAARRRLDALTHPGLERGEQRALDDGRVEPGRGIAGGNQRAELAEITEVVDPGEQVVTDVGRIVEVTARLGIAVRQPRVTAPVLRRAVGGEHLRCAPHRALRVEQRGGRPRRLVTDAPPDHARLPEPDVELATPPAGDVHVHAVEHRAPVVVGVHPVEQELAEQPTRLRRAGGAHRDRCARPADRRRSPTAATTPCRGRRAARHRRRANDQAGRRRRRSRRRAGHPRPTATWGRRRTRRRRRARTATSPRGTTHPSSSGRSRAVEHRVGVLGIERPIGRWLREQRHAGQRHRRRIGRGLQAHPHLPRQRTTVAGAGLRCTQSDHPRPARRRPTATPTTPR